MFSIERSNESWLAGCIETSPISAASARHHRYRRTKKRDKVCMETPPSRKTGIYSATIMEHRRRLQGEEADTQIRPVDDLSSAMGNSAGPLGVSEGIFPGPYGPEEDRLACHAIFCSLKLTRRFRRQDAVATKKIAWSKRPIRVGVLWNSKIATIESCHECFARFIFRAKPHLNHNLN